MNSCDFCKAMWVLALGVGFIVLVFFTMNTLVDMGVNRVCFDARLNNIHLSDCDESRYPTKNKSSTEKE